MVSPWRKWIGFLLLEPDCCALFLCCWIFPHQKHLLRENGPDLNRGHQTEWNDDWRIIQPPGEGTDSSRSFWRLYSVTTASINTDTNNRAIWKPSHWCVINPVNLVLLNKEVQPSLFLNLLWLSKATMRFNLSLSILVTLQCFKLSGFCGGWNYMFDSCDILVVLN